MESLRKCTSILAKYCDDVHSTMNNLQERADKAFERAYSDRDPNSASSSQYNPMRLIARLETLEVQSPKLSDDFMALVDANNRLPRESLTTSHATVSALLQLIPQCTEESIPNAGFLHNALEASQIELQEKIRLLRMADTQLVLSNPKVETDFAIDIDQDLKSMGILASDSPAQQQINDAVESSMKESAAKENRDVNKKPPKLNMGKQTKRTSNGLAKRSSSPASGLTRPRSARNARPTKPPAKKESVTDESLSPKFVPIQKSAYNRLPRNLKSRAGKLDALNSLYKKTYEVLVENNAPMSNLEIMAATGETDTGRFDALRGLSVVRSTAQGWELVVPKGKRQIVR